MAAAQAIVAGFEGADDAAFERSLLGADREATLRATLGALASFGRTPPMGGKLERFERGLLPKLSWEECGALFFMLFETVRPPHTTPVAEAILRDHVRRRRQGAARELAPLIRARLHAAVWAEPPELERRALETPEAETLGVGLGRVVRIRREKGEVRQGCDEYIGRGFRRGGWDLGASRWANPFPVAKHGREGALRLFRERTRAWLLAAEENRRELEALRGKTLGCWCAPERCHGDELLDLLKEFNPFRPLPEP